MITGPTIGAAFDSPVPVRNCASVDGLSAPNVRAVSGTKSTPALVTTRPNDTPLKAAPNWTHARSPVSTPADADDSQISSPCAELKVNAFVEPSLNWYS